jgi:hypothetical protein
VPDRRLRSSLCTEDQLTSATFLAWADRTRPAWDEGRTGIPVLTHRKLWEWLFIIEALAERGMLAPGRRGVGFGVGQDMLAALFAGFGCEIVATDLGEQEADRAGWVATGQHAADPSQLNRYGLCDPRGFEERVTFRRVDMNAIPPDLTGFDFSWSACAFEHLGSIERGLGFVRNQLACLRPGGVGVHTTEFNVSSDDATYETGGTVLFRRRDIEWLVRRLRVAGHAIDVDFDPGHTEADRHVDTVPYTTTHLKMMVGEYVTTSLGLIVEKRPDGPGAVLRGAAADPVLAARMAGDRLAATWARMRGPKEGPAGQPLTSSP